MKMLTWKIEINGKITRGKEWMLQFEMLIQKMEHENRDGLGEPPPAYWDTKKRKRNFMFILPFKHKVLS